MDVERFSQLAQAYGAARRRWPEDARALYDQVAATPDGARILEQAARVDALLEDFRPRADDPLRPARIVRAARTPARRSLLWISAAYAASAVLGFTIGFTALAPEENDLLDSMRLYDSTRIEDFL